jgi:SAM-dependent methyltransferase
MTRLLRPDRSIASSSSRGRGDGQLEHGWEAYYAGELTWYRHLRNVLHHLPMFRAIARLHPERVLEVGAGTGSHSIFLSYFGHDVASVDLNRRLIERCVQHGRRLRGRVRFLAMDAFRLAFADQSFDVAFSQGFFEHFADEEVVRLLEEQTRVASTVVFSVPNRSYGVQDFGNERLLSRQAWEALLTKSGYELLTSRDYAPVRGRFWRGGRDMYLAVVRRRGAAGERRSAA